MRNTTNWLAQWLLLSATVSVPLLLQPSSLRAQDGPASKIPTLLARTKLTSSEPFHSSRFILDRRPPPNRHGIFFRQELTDETSVVDWRSTSTQMGAVSPPRFSDLTEHPGNRALHVALELGVWGAFGAWGYDRGSGAGRYALMVGLPLGTITTWTILGVPDDPWRPGIRSASQPRVAIPGWSRLVYEVAVHGLAAWAFHDLGWTPGSVGMVSGTFVHYAVSYQRVAWLFGHQQE